MGEVKPASRDRVFLVIVDDTPEMRAAFRYASRRARHTDGRVAMLHVIEPTEGQHWMALEELMREERREEAEEIVGKLAAQLVEMTGVQPVVHIREGEPAQEILALINADPEISVLVLAAAAGEGGPGPLVSAMSNNLIGRLRVPLTIVPGSLTDAEIDALS